MTRSNVLIKINGDAANFSSELKKVEKETKDVGQNLGKIAAVSSVGFGVLTAAIGATVNEYREGLKVSKSVEQTIKATGGAAGVTAADVDKLSLALQKVTNFGDETISSAQGMLLTFTNLKANVFPQVTELALDMANKFGGAEVAAEFLGKALNNPIRGMSLLAKSGEIFTAEQKKVVENLVHTGQVAEAQAILIERLQSRYGGQARAAADPFIQLREVMGDIAQYIGGVFYPAVSVMVTGLKNVAFYLLEVNPLLLKIAAYTIGATTAILGLTAAFTAGALVYLKVTSIWTAYAASAGIAATASGALAGAMTLLGRAVTVATGPIGIVTVVLGSMALAIYKNFDEFKAFFTGLIAAFQSFGKDLSAMGASISTLLSGIFSLDREKIAEGLAAVNDAFKQGGDNAAKAYAEAYNASLAESKLARAEEESQASIDPTANQAGIQEQADYEYEVEKEKKEKKLDLEKQYQEELAKIHQESAQIEQNAEAFKAVELARIDLDEKKRKLSDEAKYGKAHAEIKAFWRTKEAQGTDELFSTLSTLTRSKNKELFMLGKAAAYGHAVINVAQGVTRTLAEYPFPLNAALATAVSLAGAVQIATISGQTLNAAKGYSGSGSPFGESFVSTFTPREIVIPERFSEGIKKGEFSLSSSKDSQMAAAGEVTVHIALAEDAVDVLEVQRIERNKIGIGVG